MGELTLNSSRVGRWWSLSVQENCILHYNTQGAGEMVCLGGVVLAFHFTAALQHMVTCTEGSQWLPVTPALTEECWHFSSLGAQAGFHFFLSGWQDYLQLENWGRTAQPLPSEGDYYQALPTGALDQHKGRNYSFCIGLLKQISKTLFLLEHGSSTSNAVGTK